MRLFRAIPFLVSGTAALALAGCLSTPTVHSTRYYTLTPAIEMGNATASGKTLGVRPIVSARPYKLEVAYTAEPNRLAYFTHAEWAEAPATVVDRALTDALLASGQFRDVGEAGDMTRPDYVMTGELRRFDADFTGDAPRVVVEADLVVREATGPGTLWQGHLVAESPIAGPEVTPTGSDAQLAAIASALAEAVSTLVQEACAGIQHP